MIEQLRLAGARLNYVIHRVEASDGMRGSRFTITMQYLAALIEWLSELGITDSVRLYFDDNDSTFFENVLPEIDIENLYEVVLAVPVASIDSPGHGTMAQLFKATDMGIRIAAHGMTHVPLAWYDESKLLPTPPGGRYKTVESHVRRSLFENEVLYQLVESSEYLRKFEPSEFVLPFGCFNETTVAINERHGVYEFLGTSDFDLDLDQVLRPRRIITNDTTISDLERELADRLGEPLLCE